MPKLIIGLCTSSVGFTHKTFYVRDLITFSNKQYQTLRHKNAIKTCHHCFLNEKNYPKAPCTMKRYLGGAKYFPASGKLRPTLAAPCATDRHWSSVYSGIQSGWYRVRCRPTNYFIAYHTQCEFVCVDHTSAVPLPNFELSSQGHHYAI